MKTLVWLCTVVLLLTLFNTCKEKEDDIGPVQGPVVEWIKGGTTTTYSYSGGVLSAYYFHRSFKVLKESGEVTIHVQVADHSDTRVTAVFQVEKDKQYKLSVKASKSGSSTSSPGSNCMTVEFGSPNSSTTEKITVNSYLVPAYNEWMTDQYYCPMSLSFGEITISEP